MSELRDSVVLVRLAYQAMKTVGIDAPEVLRRIGMNESHLNVHDLRTPHSAQGRFWKIMEEMSGDPDIGLHLGEAVPVYRGQVLEYLFLSSPTFGEGLRRALNYQRLLSDAVQASLGEDERGYFIRHSTQNGQSVPHNTGTQSPRARHLVEAVMVGVIKFFRYVTEDGFKPFLIEFEYEKGAALAEYERVFGCPVKLGCSENRIYFHPDVMEIPSLHAEPELMRLHEQVASEHVARLEKQDFISSVNRLIAELLESGHADLETVAERLGMKPRSLRTRLSEAGTNFNQLLADYRCQLAKRLLAKTGESIDEIVYLTGFSEPSTFYRAFKRWVGLTPIEYRKRRQGG